MRVGGLVGAKKGRDLPALLLNLCVCPANKRFLKRRRRDSNPRYPVKRYCGAMMSPLFAGVQKLLQIGVFFLFSHRTCSSLFMQVGVSVGVNGVSFDVDLYLYPLPLT
jgi:hypothetical protein